MPLPPLDSVAVKGAGRSWEVVLVGASVFLRCVGGGWRACSLASREEGGGRVCFWAEAGMCMLTCSLLLEPSSSRVGRVDCRYLHDNAITELAASLFNKLTNLNYLYVTLNAAMHAPSPAWLCGGEGRWAFVRG